MHSSSRLLRLCLLLLFCSGWLPQPVPASELKVLAIPSLMDSEMDGWYRIPQNSGPMIPRVSHVVTDQPFTLLVFLGGFAVDPSGRSAVTYDVLVEDPAGNATHDSQSGLSGVSGQDLNPQSLMLSDEGLMFILTEAYQPGPYRITVTAFDQVSSQTAKTEVSVDLVPFTMPAEFSSMEELGTWMMRYYRSLDPVRAISAVRYFVETDAQWLRDNAHALHFFITIFADNPYLFKHLGNHLKALSPDDRRKFLLIAALVGDSTLPARLDPEDRPEWQAIQQTAAGIRLPDLTGVIDTPDQQDMLWGEFFATGRYEPIRKLVSSLALIEPGGTKEDLISSLSGLSPEEKERKIRQYATGQAAVWSLTSNCAQHPLVMKYCTTILEQEELTDPVRQQLRVILQNARDRAKSEGTEAPQF